MATATSALSGDNETFARTKFWPHDAVLGLLPLLLGFQILLATVYVPLALRGLADFRQLYTGGYMIRVGHAHQLYDYATQQDYEEKLVPVGAHFLLPINHLAYEELLFVPLSLFSYRTAYWFFMVFNGALLVGSVMLLRTHVGPLSERWAWLPALLIAAFYPISRALMQGQDSIITLMLLIASLSALNRKKEFLAGLLVGLSVYKFQIAVPIAVLFALWRCWRFVIGFSLSSAAAALVSLWLVGISGAKEYVSMLLSMSVRLTSQVDMLRYSTNPKEMINLRGLFSGVLNGTLPHNVVQVLVAVFSIVVLLIAARKPPSLPLAIAAASLVSYHLIVHDASILIIVVAAALCSRSICSGGFAVLLLITPLSAVIPVYGYLATVPLLGLFVSMLWGDASLISGSQKAGLEHAC
jgi:hypothetical protein